jgi:hypothetical protein
MKNLEGLRIKERHNTLRDPWIYASGIALVMFVILVHNSII